MFRPDITVVAGWALKINYLSIHEMLYMSDTSLKCCYGNLQQKVYFSEGDLSSLWRLELTVCFCFRPLQVENGQSNLIALKLARTLFTLACLPQSYRGQPTRESRCPGWECDERKTLTSRAGKWPRVTTVLAYGLTKSFQIRFSSVCLTLPRTVVQGKLTVRLQQETVVYNYLRVGNRNRKCKKNSGSGFQVVNGLCSKLVTILTSLVLIGARM